MKLTLEKFRTKYDGDRVGQCVILARKWIDEGIVGGNSIALGIMPIVGSAKDFLTAAPRKYWSVHKPGKGKIPPKGAVVILDTSSVHEHVFISKGKKGPTNGTVAVFESNYARALTALDGSHRLTGIIGWLTPRTEAIRARKVKR